MSAILLQCFIAVIISLKVMAYSPLTCDTGFYQYNQTIKRFNVTQDYCKGAHQKNCYQQCSNYTDEVSQFKATSYPGLFNITWKLYGKATIYLMKYSIQPQYGIQDRYQTCLHFPGTKTWPSQGWYKVILQCNLPVLSIIRVTLKLPSGVLNSTSKITTYKTTKGTTKLVYGVNTLPTEEPQKAGNNQGEPISKSTTVAIVISVVILVAAVTAVYMRQVRKKRANANLTEIYEMTCEETNNNTSTYNNYIPTSYNESLFQTRNLNDEHHITQQNCDKGNPRNHKDKSSVSKSNLERLKTINSNGEQTLQHTSIPSRRQHTSYEYSDVFDSNSNSNNTHNVQSIQAEPNIWIHDTATVQDTNTNWFHQRTEQHVPFPSHLRNMIISLNLEE